MSNSRIGTPLAGPEVGLKGPHGEVGKVRSSVGKLKLRDVAAAATAILLTAASPTEGCDCGSLPDSLPTSSDTDSGSADTGKGDAGQESVDETGGGSNGPSLDPGAIGSNELCSGVGMVNCDPAMAYRSSQDKNTGLYTRDITTGQPNRVVTAIPDEVDWRWNRDIILGSNVFGVEDSTHMAAYADVDISVDNAGVAYAFGYGSDCSDPEAWSVQVAVDQQDVETTGIAFPYGDDLVLMAGTFDISDTGPMEIGATYDLTDADCDLVTYLISSNSVIQVEDESSYVFMGAGDYFPRYLVGVDTIGDSVEGYFGEVAVGGVQTGTKVEN